MKKEIWGGDYMSLFDDGTIGVSDGVGYVGDEEDVKGLYLALKKFFESEGEK